jgi:hypothetical protein
MLQFICSYFLLTLKINVYAKYKHLRWVAEVVYIYTDKKEKKIFLIY